MTVPSRRRAWQVLAGVAVSALLLYFSLRGLHFREVWAHVLEARPGPLLLCVCLATSTFVLRIFRWQVLLRAEDGSRLRAGPLWHAIAMGFMANNILPLRVGEVVRTYAASQLTGTRFTAALASIGVERLFDAMTVIALLLLGLLRTSLPPGAMAGFNVGALVTAAILIAALGLMSAGLVLAFPLAAERLVRAVVPSDRVATRLVGVIEGIRQGLGVLRSPARVLAVVAWSFAIWGVSVLSFQAGFLAFGIPVDTAGALVMQGIIMFGIALPSTPGYVGAFELPIIAVLALHGVDKGLAAAYALTYHVTTFVPITLLGAWSVARTNLALTAFRQGGK
ncbi:MAG: flippase-like domain-containing protein [Gemmatimonadota bacterium]|nr:flippase-like domain-containing protein [Gemmatimonadota bacterium]